MTLTKLHTLPTTKSAKADLHDELCVLLPLAPLAYPHLTEHWKIILLGEGATEGEIDCALVELTEDAGYIFTAHTDYSGSGARTHKAVACIQPLTPEAWDYLHMSPDPYDPRLHTLVL